MRQRKDMECGKDLTPAECWKAFCTAQHKTIVESVTLARIRDDIEPMEETTPDQ